MKASSITTVVALALAGTTFAASDFQNSCSDIVLAHVNGNKGRSTWLSANCTGIDKKENWSKLDLNTCFGWSADSCGFTFPPSGHFTDSVSSCDIHNNGSDEPHSHDNFGCHGPCSGRGETYNVFALSRSNDLVTLFFLVLASRPLTQIFDRPVRRQLGRQACLLSSEREILNRGNVFGIWLRTSGVD